jgi:methionyl-tRNA formyltransferase
VRLRVAFLGYGQLGATVLRGLHQHHHVALVVTHRPEFSGMAEPDVVEAALDLGVDVTLSSHAREPELHRRLRDLDADVIVSTNWRTPVPKDVLCVPRLGAVNIHDALLPRYAGLGAVNWAIRNGDRTTGLTAHLMDEELDTGPVITQTRVEIGPHDTAADVLERLLSQYVPVALRALELLELGHRGTPQALEEGTFYHRIGLEDTRIQWLESTTSVYNLVRAQVDPFLNSWTTYRGQRLFVKSATPPTRAYCGTPGRIVKVAEGGIAVACGQPGATDSRGIILRCVQVEGQEPVQAIDLFRRFGDYLGAAPA